MLVRFSLYGFLKNLRLFEPFLVLALLDRGHDFLAIGTLVAVREVVANGLEVPSGAFADLVGRRRCMVASFGAYTLAYLLLGWATAWWILAVAMALVGMGDAFRSGTHKALIYAWLREQGRGSERTKVYGYTRSWSKRGSAVSALAGGVVVFTGQGYAWVFYASAIPAVLNLVNLATYPAGLDEGSRSASRGKLEQTLREGLLPMLRSAPLRQLARRGAALEGGYSISKDYLQPLLLAVAIAWPWPGPSTLEQRTGLLGGLVGFALFWLASMASRRAHRWEAWRGGPDRAARGLAGWIAGAYGVLLFGVLMQWHGLCLLVFIALAIGQNLWRPIHVGRFEDHGDPRWSAMVLSLEAQVRSLTVAIGAPVVGAVLDATGYRADGGGFFGLWPVPVLALGLLAIGWGRPGPK